MRYILVLALLIASPLLWFLGYGFYQGFDVPSGLASTFRMLTKTNLFYNVPVATPDLPIKAKHRPVIWNGDLENEKLREASGLAASFVNPGIYFSINDSGNAPELFAFHGDGSDAGVWEIDYSEKHDFEDIASFSYKDERYLLIADTGDNFYWRPEVHLLVLIEPELRQLGGGYLKPAWVITYRYPNGARDVEAVSVDEKKDKVFLISKRRVPPEIFSVPLRPNKNVVTANYEGRLSGLPQPSARDLREDPDYGGYRSLPTALALRGKQAIVITYRDAYLFNRRGDEPWPHAYARVPKRIPLPNIFGLEAGSFHSSRNSLLIVGERKNGVARSGVYEVDL